MNCFSVVLSVLWRPTTKTVYRTVLIIVIIGWGYTERQWGTLPEWSILVLAHRKFSYMKQPTLPTTHTYRHTYETVAEDRAVVSEQNVTPAGLFDALPLHLLITISSAAWECSTQSDLWSESTAINYRR